MLFKVRTTFISLTETYLLLSNSLRVKEFFGYFLLLLKEININLIIRQDMN